MLYSPTTWASEMIFLLFLRWWSGWVGSSGARIWQCHVTNESLSHGIINLCLFYSLSFYFICFPPTWVLSSVRLVIQNRTLHTWVDQMPELLNNDIYKQRWLGPLLQVTWRQDAWLSSLWRSQAGPALADKQVGRTRLHLSYKSWNYIYTFNFC